MQLIKFLIVFSSGVYILHCFWTFTSHIFCLLFHNYRCTRQPVLGCNSGSVFHPLQEHSENIMKQLKPYADINITLCSGAMNLIEPGDHDKIDYYSEPFDFLEREITV